jgi:hypothetical protein
MTAPHNPNDPVNRLRLQDEILQLMFWMKGEGLAAAPTITELLRLIDIPRDELEQALQRMCLAGLVASSGEKFRLTQAGHDEGARRFSEEFAPYLGKESHLECDNPACDCHSPEFSGVCRNAIQ